MLANPPRDRRAERNAATRREILDAAWEVIRAEGLAALSMRDLGARVGMRAQSLYGYFPSKFAIYDAMFAESNEQLLRRLSTSTSSPDPVARLRAQAHTFVAFSVEDPARYQLIFQRAVPGFEPSPDAFAPAQRVIEAARAELHACGITEARAFDAWTAVIAGVAAQQNSNEPGGDRWARLIDQITDMYLAYYRPPARKRRTPQ